MLLGLRSLLLLLEPLNISETVNKILSKHFGTLCWHYSNNLSKSFVCFLYDFIKHKSGKWHFNRFLNIPKRIQKCMRNVEKLKLKIIYICINYILIEYQKENSEKWRIDTDPNLRNNEFKVLQEYFLLWLCNFP